MLSVLVQRPVVSVRAELLICMIVLEAWVLVSFDWLGFL